MKKLFPFLALLILAGCQPVVKGQWVNSVPTIDDLLWLNAYDTHSNVVAVCGTTKGDNLGGLFSFYRGAVDPTNDMAHFGPFESLNPASPAGRWICTIQGANTGGTNIFNYLIVTNLTVINNLVTTNFFITNITSITTNAITFFTNVYITNANIYLNGTNIPAINPTMGYVPYNQDGTNFGDSPIYVLNTNTIQVYEVDANDVLVTNLQTGGVVVSLLTGEVTNLFNGTGALTNDGAGNLGWASMTNIVINPTDGYLPYRSNSTTFGDSPWYRISTNRMGFNGTGNFLYANSGGAVGIGLEALANSAANNNTAIGNWAMQAHTNGTYNVALGNYALQNLTNGAENIALGPETMTQVAMGKRNIAIGSGALASSGGVANPTNNVAIGWLSGEILTTGTGNTFVGDESGDAFTTGNFNTALGFEAGHRPQTSSSFNVALGALAGYNSSNAATNTISIGYFAGATNSNEIVIGNTNNTATYMPPLLTLGADVAGPSQIVWGPGTTNVLYRAGSDLIYTNGNTAGVRIKVIDGGANEARFGVDSGGNANVIAGAGKDVKIGPDLGGELYYFHSTGFYPQTTNMMLGLQTGMWGDAFYAGHGYYYGYWGNSGLDYIRLAISSTGTNTWDTHKFDSQSAGTAGTPRPIMFTNQPTVIIAGTTNFLTFGATNAAPSDPGTIDKWVSVSINGEATEYRIPLYK